MVKWLMHYNIPGSHWGERRWQYKDGRLTPEGKIRYSKGGRERADHQLDLTIGVSTTAKKQQNRYLRWARAHEERAANTDRSKRGELARAEILARKSEAKMYQEALRHTRKDMESFMDKEVPRGYYNEDYVSEAFHKAYYERVIEPAWKRFDAAINIARNVDETDKRYSRFLKNKERMGRYGYSETPTHESLDIGLSMEKMAYVEYILAKEARGDPLYD